MINALLVQFENNKTQSLEESIHEYCNGVRISKKLKGNHELLEILNSEGNSDLVFFDINTPSVQFLQVLNQLNSCGVAYVIVSKNKSFAYEAIQLNATGFVHKPINPADLMLAIRNVKTQILRKQKEEKNLQIMRQISQKLSDVDKIGVPTMEGFDFIFIDEIIRCEGMQKCTLIVTKQRKKLVSSYNLGEFRKRLEPFGFFSSHKSHLINLKQIRQYKREGSIIMSDNTCVPVSRRRRNDFLDVVFHV